MSKRFILAIMVILVLSLMVSCSGGSGTVTAPDNGGNKAVAEAGNGTAVAGLWQIVADKNSGSLDVVQLRSADKMLNVIGFMEPPPLTLMDLDWPALVIDFVAGTIHVGVKLTHPLGADPDATFTGFDVRGVCFGPTVVNADGLTKVMSPEFFSGEAFGYQDGLLGVPDSVGNYSGWAGYKYYCDGIGADDVLSTFMGVQANVDNRGKFTGTQPHQRNFDLKWANPADILVFNYAIYANYDWPVGTAPFALDEFPITTANSAEAFCAKATEVSNSLWYSGGSGGGAISLDVEVWDWLGDISGVTIESVTPGIIPSTPFDSADGPGSTTKSWEYSFDDIAAAPITSTNLDIMITVTDAKTFGQAWFLDLLSAGNSLHDTQVYAAWIHSAAVADCPSPNVTSVSPVNGNGSIPVFTVNGTGFLAGASLGVKLTKTSAPDIVGTAVVWVSAIKVTCALTIPGAAPTGLYNVVVTNGCGTPGTLISGFTVTPPLYSESFGSNPSNWFYAASQWEPCGPQPAPLWTTNAPFGTSGSGNIRSQTTGVSGGGGYLSTVVSAPFAIPTGASEVNIRVYQCIGFGPNSWGGFYNANWKIVASATPGIAPFNSTTGAIPGGGAILLRSIAHGSTWAATGTACFYGPLSGQVGWNQALYHGGFAGASFPASLTSYIDLVVPASFYGQTVKICWQMQPDECYGYGNNSGYAFDDVAVKTY